MVEKANRRAAKASGMGAHAKARSKAAEVIATPSSPLPRNAGSDWAVVPITSAVDRSPLAPALMKDAVVTFLRGDAFAYEPERAAGEATTWMVSDVIAYPERVAELLRRWCGAGWAARLVAAARGKPPRADRAPHAAPRG